VSNVASGRTVRRVPPGASSGRPQQGGRLRLFVVLGALVALLIIIFLVVRSCGGDSDNCEFESSGVTFRCLDASLPQGFIALSPVYSLETEEEGAAVITLRLDRVVPADTELGFYEVSGGTARLIEPATLGADGESASAQLTEFPQTLAVLSPSGGISSAGGQVVAYLPAGASLNPEALTIATIVHPLDHFPAPDGTIQGSPSGVSGDFEVIPTILATSSNGGSGAVDVILSDAALRSDHAAAIVNLVNSNGYAGIDIAYTDVDPEQAASFTLFVRELGQALRDAGKRLTLTLPPPARGGADFSGGPYDWANLAPAADYLQLLPERDQSIYRTRMPEILQFLSAQVIDPTKLVLVVSPFAAEKGVDGIRTMTLADAMAIATVVQPKEPEQPIVAGQRVGMVAPNINRESGAFPLSWNEETATVTFTYSSRTVWIENAFSIPFKLELVERFRLGGFAVEDASNNPGLGSFWPVLTAYAAAGEPVLLQPNPASLTPVWEASAGELEGVQGEVIWNTPVSPGAYEITLTLSDGVAQYSRTTAFDVVQEGAPPTVPEETGTPAGESTPTGESTPVG
jgi:hypothetical protein